MKKLLLTIALISSLASPSYAAEEEKAKGGLGPLMNMFGMTTLATTYYAHCKPEELKLTDEQVRILMQNNVVLRAYVSGFLMQQNPDVPKPTMVTFIKSAVSGLEFETAQSIKEDGCGKDKWGKYIDYLKKASTEDLRKGVDEMKNQELTLEQAKAMLESIKNDYSGS